MFYERYLELCKNARMSPSGAATKAGFNRGTVSVWKKKYLAGEDVYPEQAIIRKICEFFGCTEQWLRGIKTDSITPPMYEHIVTDSDLMYALWGCAAEVDEKDLADVRRYAEFLRMKKRSII